MSKTEMNNPQMELNTSSEPRQIIEQLQNASAVYTAMKELKAIIADGGQIDPQVAKATEQLTGIDINALFSQQAEPAPTKPKERRQHRHPKGIYNLGNFMSFRELAKTTGKKEREVKAVLMQLGIVRKIEEPGIDSRRWRYGLTDKGWQYGRMYYLREKIVLEQNDRRFKQIPTNSVPVFGYDVLDFFA